MLNVVITKSLGNIVLDARYSLGNETMLVTGPSGSGKTTMLRCLAGLEHPDAGFISYKDTCYFDTRKVNIPPYRRSIGFMSQANSLFPHYTVKENMLYACSKKNKTPGLYQDLLECLGLSFFEHVSPQNLSGGEKRRVMLARVMLQFPQLLLLDEPFTGLDDKMAKNASQIVANYCKKYNPTVLIVTHDKQKLIPWASRILHINAGKTTEKPVLIPVIAGTI